MEKIITGNDFRLIVDAQKMENRASRFDLNQLERCEIYLVKAGRARILQSYTLDDVGRAIIDVDGDALTTGTWGVEIVGTYLMASIRSTNAKAFQIVDGLNNGGMSGDGLEITVDVLILANSEATRPYVDYAIAEHDANTAAHPTLQAAIDEKVADVKINGTSVVDGGKVANVTMPTKVSDLDNDSEYTTKTYVDAQVSAAGRVDDVEVNGTSVLDGKTAKITMPTKTSDLSNDSDFATNASVDAKVATAGHVDDVQVNGASVVSGKVANVVVPTSTNDITNDSDFQSATQVQQAVDDAIAENLITGANVSIDSNTGTPSATVTKNGNSLDFAFHNMKGEKGDPMTFNDLTPAQKEELKGPQGDSAVYDPTTGNIAAIKQGTGDDVNSPMSQKALTEEVTQKIEVKGISFNDGKGVQTNGALKTNSALSYTDYIDISSYDELIVPVLGLSSSYGWALYDANKDYLRGGSNPGPDLPATFLFDYINVSDAAYLRFTAFATTSQYYTSNPPLYYIRHLNAIVGALADEMAALESAQIEDGIYNYTSADVSLYNAYDKYVNENGVWANSKGNSTCKFLPVTPFENYKVENGDNATIHHVFFVVDNDRTTGNPPNLAGGLSEVPKSTSDTEYITAPSDAAYMYIRTKSGGADATPKVSSYDTIKDKITTSDNRNPKTINVGTWENGYIQSEGEERASNSYCRTSFIKADNLISVVSQVAVSVNCYDSNYNHIILAQNYGTSFTQWPVECAFVRLWIAHSDPTTADAVLTITKNVGGNGRLASLDGKSVVTFGDSITWYDGKNYLNGKAEGDFVFGYQHYMRMAGMSTCNKGESGYESKRILNVVRSFTRFAQMDYMTLMTGANDERLYVNVGVVLPIGSTYDTNTYAGALQTIIEYALSINPRLKIVLFTPIKGWFYGDDPRMIRDDYVDAVKAIGKIYSIPVLDLHNLIGLNNLTRDIMINDPEPPENELYSLHPSNYGYERMASVILPFLADV